MTTDTALLVVAGAACAAVAFFLRALVVEIGLLRTDLTQIVNRVVRLETKEEHRA